MPQGSQEELLWKLNITLSLYLAKEHWQTDVATPQVGWRVLGEMVFRVEDGGSCLISLLFWCSEIGAHTSSVSLPLFSSCSLLREGMVEPLVCPLVPHCFFDREASWMPLLLQNVVFCISWEKCRLTWKLRLGCWHASGDKFLQLVLIYSFTHSFTKYLLSTVTRFYAEAMQQRTKLKAVISELIFFQNEICRASLFLAAYFYFA